MQPDAEETRSRHGDMPRDGTDQRPLVQSLLERAGHGLEPLHMEPPQWTDGLRPVSFGDGLEELHLETLRSGGRPAVRRELGSGEALRLAAKRATELGLMR